MTTTETGAIATSEASPPHFNRVRRRLADAVCLLVFVVTALAATWPLAMDLRRALPMGFEGVPTVPLLNLWTVWWNADRAASGFNDYWNAPIFYPEASSFVCSEAQPTTLAVAPIVWLSDDAILAYNTYLLASLTLNGVLAYWLLRSRLFGRWSALTAGILTQTLPFIFWQLGVLQLTVVWPSLWTIGLSLRLLQSPRWRTALLLGLAFGVTYASCNYYGLFLAVVLSPAALCYLNRSWLDLASWLKLLLAAFVAAALISPIVVKQQSESARQAWSRDEETVHNLSAHARDYSDAPYPQWLDLWEDAELHRHNIWSLGSGWLKLVGAIAGFFIGILLPKYRRWTLFTGLFALLAWWFSLGPAFILWTVSPYDVLRDCIPGFAQIRSPFRFAVFVQMAIVWLTAVMVDVVVPGDCQKGRWNRSMVARCLTAGGLSFVFVAETRPALQRLYYPPTTSPMPQWVEFLRDETPQDAAVACLPMALGTSVYDYEDETLWMYWSMLHRRRLVNGYSGYFPQAYVDVRVKLLEFPNKGTPELQKLGAEFVVVRRDFESQSVIERHPATRDWTWLFSDEIEKVDVYRIERISELGDH